MTDPNNPYLNQAPPTNGPMGGKRGLFGELHDATSGLRGMLPQSPIGSALGLPSPTGNQPPPPMPVASPMGPPPAPAPPMASPIPPAPAGPMPPSGGIVPMNQTAPQQQRPTSGFNPRSMVRATGPARGAQMERMARPTGARQGLAQAKATGNLPGSGGPPKPPQY